MLRVKGHGFDGDQQTNLASGRGAPRDAEHLGVVALHSELIEQDSVVCPQIGVSELKPVPDAVGRRRLLAQQTVVVLIEAEHAQQLEKLDLPPRLQRHVASLPIQQARPGRRTEGFWNRVRARDCIRLEPGNPLELLSKRRRQGAFVPNARDALVEPAPGLKCSSFDQDRRALRGLESEIRTKLRVDRRIAGIARHWSAITSRRFLGAALAAALSVRRRGNFSLSPKRLSSRVSIRRLRTASPDSRAALGSQTAGRGPARRPQTNRLGRLVQRAPSRGRRQPAAPGPIPVSATSPPDPGRNELPRANPAAASPETRASSRSGPLSSEPRRGPRARTRGAPRGVSRRQSRAAASPPCPV